MFVGDIYLAYVYLYTSVYMSTASEVTCMCFYMISTCHKKQLLILIPLQHLARIVRDISGYVTQTYPSTPSKTMSPPEYHRVRPQPVALVVHGRSWRGNIQGMQSAIMESEDQYIRLRDCIRFSKHSGIVSFICHFLCIAHVVHQLTHSHYFFHDPKIIQK